jgi:hypothetical protein
MILKNRRLFEQDHARTESLLAAAGGRAGPSFSPGIDSSQLTRTTECDLSSFANLGLRNKHSKWAYHCPAFVLLKRLGPRLGWVEVGSCARRLNSRPSFSDAMLPVMFSNHHVWTLEELAALMDANQQPKKRGPYKKAGSVSTP